MLPYYVIVYLINPVLIQIDVRDSEQWTGYKSSITLFNHSKVIMMYKAQHKWHTYL